MKKSTNVNGNEMVINRLNKALEVLKDLRAGKIEKFDFSEMGIVFKYKCFILDHDAIYDHGVHDEDYYFFEVGMTDIRIEKLSKSNELIEYAIEKIEDLLNNLEKIENLFFGKEKIYIELDNYKEIEEDELYLKASENSIYDLLANDKESLDQLLLFLDSDFSTSDYEIFTKEMIEDEYDEDDEDEDDFESEEEKKEAFADFLEKHLKEKYREYDANIDWQAFFTNYSQADCFYYDDEYYIINGLNLDDFEIDDIPEQVVERLAQNNLEGFTFDEIEEMGEDINDYYEIMTRWEEEYYNVNDLERTIRMNLDYQENVVIVKGKDVCDYKELLFKTILGL